MNTIPIFLFFSNTHNWNTIVYFIAVTIQYIKMYFTINSVNRMKVPAAGLFNKGLRNTLKE